jgi:dihydrofolate reductase
MPVLTSIVARNACGAIGAANRLPWKVRSDLRFFRETTLDQIVIMGRKTHRSLGGCLPRRTNIVVTHDASSFEGDTDCLAVGSVEEALCRAFKMASSEKKQVFVIGGATIYRQFAPYVDRYLVTEVEKPVPDADAFFDERPIIAAAGSWQQNVLKSGEADGAGDEASFRIIEYVARDSGTIASARERAISTVSKMAPPISAPAKLLMMARAVA